jgi:hypothetical protein
MEPVTTDSKDDTGYTKKPVTRQHSDVYLDMVTPRGAG